LTLLVGQEEEHPTCKKTEWWDAGVVMCLGQDADLHMAQLMPPPLTTGCAKKSNPLQFFVNISIMNWNFYKKIYANISHSYLRICAKLCYIPSTFD